MERFPRVVTAFVLLVGVAWAAFSIAVLWNVRHVPDLPGLEQNQSDPRQPPPRVSVAIAARDESHRIGQTVEQLLAQREVELELIVVDDRSTDATQAILAEFAARDPRLRVVRVDELPPGWLGKCHACHLGTQQATGEWILLTDADVHMRPDVIARAVATARRDGAAHLTLWPAVSCTGTWTRAAVLGWVQMFSVYAPAALINRDLGRRAVGIGAFNLVRADAYRAVGGYERLRMEVIDDLKLGILLRRAGFRQRMYSGTSEIEVHWAQSVLDELRLLEKNWFAGVQFNLAKGAIVIFVMLGMWLTALAAPLLWPGIGWLATAGLASTAIPAAVQARMFGWPVASALATPLMVAVFPIAGVRSIWKTLRQGGIRWRGTFYPLRELRAGAVGWRE